MIHHSEKILDQICAYFNVEKKRVLSRLRYADLVNVRKFVSYILREADQLKGRYTYSNIAQLLNRIKSDGMPDHTVALHYHQKFDNELLIYPGLKDELFNLLSQLNLTMSAIYPLQKSTGPVMDYQIWWAQNKDRILEQDNIDRMLRIKEEV